MIIIVMGVSGSGKSTFGQALARALGWTFVEGDALHPPANVDKMRNGIALTDSDRQPWLETLRARIGELDAAGHDAVVACSALRQAYRDVLDRGADDIRYIWLHGDRDTIARRMRRRRGHYMPSTLLDSQFSTLEAPADAVLVDIQPAVGRQVDTALTALGMARQ